MNVRVDTPNATEWQKPVGELAETKRPSLRICDRKRISRSDAKGIIVGVHERQP